ncbi:MAG: TIR domain-containing protein [Gammaproteobacteria bacterium]|nr:TIR domain-containing protein [Gammaproteobacteria bacterium]
MQKTILILAANPKDTTPLRLDKEAREIESGLQRSQRRDDFTLKHQWAARPVDMRRAMLDFSPNIVHYCGHGEGEAGIVLETNTGESNFVSTNALTELFKLFAEHVECVLLNACYSEIQAEAIATHIDYVIGMNQAIGDQAAIEFAVAFYDALGAGKSIEFAYQLGCAALRMAGLPDELTPVLRKKSTFSDTQPKPHITASFTKDFSYDLFISHTQADASWVTALTHSLKVMLDPKLGQGQNYNISSQAQHIAESAVFMFFLSPSWMGSEACQQALQQFLHNNKDSRERLFIIEKEPVELPADLRNLPVYKFWHHNSQGQPQTLGCPTPKPEEFQYYQHLDELAGQMAIRLKSLKNKDKNPEESFSVTDGRQSVSQTSPVAIFLAEASDDLQAQRNSVKSYLEQHGLQVVPQTLYYFPELRQLEQAIDSDLKKSILFVQLLSLANPQRPPGMTTPSQQYQLAKTIQRTRELPIVQWRSPALNIDMIDDSLQQALLNSDTVMATSLEEFKQTVIRQAEAIEIKKRVAEQEHLEQTRQVSLSSGNTLVFINTSPEDASLANQISTILTQHGVGSSLPLLEGTISPKEKRQDLEGNLLDCNAVIVVYDHTSVVWVREQLRYCRRIQGKREDPLKIIAVFNRSSSHKPALHMNLPDLQMIEFTDLQAGDGFPSFIKALFS